MFAMSEIYEVLGEQERDAIESPLTSLGKCEDFSPATS
jgi:hypothetical protein